MISFDNIPQAPPAPEHPRPIVSIGAGGIVRDAHYPAYRIAGYDVQGVFDLEQQKARSLADAFGVPTVYDTIDAATDHAPGAVIYDIAVPASALPDLIPHIPD